MTQGALIEGDDRKRAVGGEAEFFPTPTPLCTAICKTVDEVFRELYHRAPETIIEPGAGSGNFVRAAHEQWPEATIHAVDVVDTSKDCYAAGAESFTLGRWEDEWPNARSEKPDLVLGNPSFSLAVPHVEASLNAMMPRGGLLAFLLRISIEEWTKKPPFPRAEFWPKHPLRARAPIAQRASFDGKGTDSTGYALFFWQAGWWPWPTNRGWILPAIDWKGA